MTDIERLDRVFSQYIRKRDCPNGIGRCITCGKIITPDTCDAGHYISRRITATRWNEANVHAQCIECNRFGYGKIDEYRQALIALYGVSVVAKIEQLGKTMIHLRKSDYEALTKHYKQKLYTL